MCSFIQAINNLNIKPFEKVPKVDELKFFCLQRGSQFLLIREIEEKTICVDALVFVTSICNS